jgi:hypothetical protein
VKQGASEILATTLSASESLNADGCVIACAFQV